MRGSQFRTDQIITLDLNRFKGSLQETIIRIKLHDGQNIEIPKNKMNLPAASGRGIKGDNIHDIPSP